MSDTIKPVAWRVECRWVDPSKGGDWRKYADYGTLLAAQTSQQRFANPGDIESRIVPLVRANDAINAIEEQSMVAVKLAFAIDHIREALQAGPTPGPWGYETASMGTLDSMLVVEHFVRRDGDDISIAADIVDPQSGSPSEANAAYIAACSPDRIERVLAELERLRAFEAGVIALLPGVCYMDPPDGGDVPPLEQVRRMAKDAERYRHLRRKVAIVGAEFRVMNLPSPTFVAPIAAIEFDSAIDKEISARTDARPPTPIGWSDTDFIKHLEDQARHPLEGLHINRGSVDAAADAYEAEYNAARGIT